MVYVGKIVSTHGIKGEIRILSDFEYKDKVFKIGKKIIVDDKVYNIKSYRHHKNFEMVTLDDYHDINDVMFLMKKKVYINEEELDLDDNEILDEELINYNVLTVSGKCGIIKEIFFGGPGNKIIRVMFDREILIPIDSPMVKEISKKDKKIVVDIIEGM